MAKQIKDKNSNKGYSDYEDLDYQQIRSRKSNRKTYRDNSGDYDDNSWNERIKDVSRFKNRKQSRKSPKRGQKQYDIW
ncbi:MAG: hypothetical protein ACW97Z_10585 [Candidatus Hodarchaeales archaeon]|jgi:hypothetical protein